MRDFFAFREMVSTGLIQALYAVGAFVLTVGGVVGALLNYQDNPALVRYGILAATLGNFVWRLLCEGLIVIYRIHDTLESIDRKLGSSRDVRGI